MISLCINGESRELDTDRCTVADLLKRLEVNAPAVAVEVNRDIVPRSRHGDHLLQSGDRIEIVTFVGGG